MFFLKKEIYHLYFRQKEQIALFHVSLWLLISMEFH